MDFNEYQRQAMGTALPTALNMDYLAPALVAELGEVFGKEAKAVRDELSSGRLSQDVVDELGDVAWMIAVIAVVREVGDLDPVDYTDPNLEDAILAAVRIQRQNTEKTRLALGYILQTVRRVAIDHGATLDTVLTRNLDKLASRQARGVLSGSGDSR